VKALSLWQPWATSIALGHKRHETRSWSTNYRGPVLIHAARTFPAQARGVAVHEVSVGRLPSRLPFGCFVALAEIEDVVPAEEVKLRTTAVDRLLGDFSEGRFAWVLVRVRPLSEPVPARGRQGLWRPTVEEVDACVGKAIAASGGGA
jgi:hypothetical protein